MDVIRKHISRILELREIPLSLHTGFSLVNAAVACASLTLLNCAFPLDVRLRKKSEKETGTLARINYRHVCPIKKPTLESVVRFAF